MGILRRVGNLFSRAAIAREIEEEIEAHLAMRAEENVACGMSARDARRDAQVRFGNLQIIRERTAAADAALMLEGVWADLRFALRRLRKSPGFVITAMLTLALAIGANTAVFSVVRATLLKRLPFDEPSRVFHVEDGYTVGLDFDGEAKNRPTAFAGAALSFKTIHEAAVYDSNGVNLDWGGGVSERLWLTQSSSRLMEVVGVEPELGRGFRADEDVPGNDQVALISDRIWRSVFNADDAAIGKSIHINGKLFTVIGVLPERMDFPAKADVWTPTIFDEDMSLREAGAFMTSVVVRMRGGVTPAQLREEFKLRASQRHAPKAPVLSPIAAELTKSIRSSLLMLTGAVLLVLLIASANIAGLMLVRGGSRRGEFAVRSALGAERWRLVRQQLVESLLVALGGGALGVLFAHGALRLLNAIRPAALANFSRPSVDVPVLVFTAVATMLTGMGFGLLPAWMASREDPATALKVGVWRTTLAGNRLRKLLVSGEVGLAFVLLMGAGLLLRTVANLGHVPLGFDVRDVLSFSVTLHGEPYESGQGTTPKVPAFYSDVLNRLSALPGVESAGAVSNLPLETRADMQLRVSGDAVATNPVAAAPRIASPGYFSTLHIPLLEGRDFSVQDSRTSGRVVIVTNDLAQKLWPGTDPIGRTLHCAWYCKEGSTVIGVVGQDRRFGPRSDGFSEYYMAYTQQDWQWMTFVVRSNSGSSGAETLISSVRKAVAAVDPTQPVYDIKTMHERLNDNESLELLELYALGVFAGLSMVLALVGLYGVLSSTVSQRTREFAVRLALGAQRGAIQRGVLFDGGMLTIVGSAAGCIASLALTRLLSATLFGVTPHDTATICGVFVVFLVVAMVASYLPAHRAARVNIIQALRNE